MYAEPEDQE